MEDANASAAQVEELKQKLDAHTSLAQEGYRAFHYDQELSQQSWSKHQSPTLA